MATAPSSTAVPGAVPDAVRTRIARVPPGLRWAVLWLLRARRRWLLLRHLGRVTCGEDVMVVGRLRITQGTRVHLGARTRVRGRVTVNGGGEVRVGEDTLLNGCWIGATRSVTVGDRCLVSDCDITDSDFHNLDPERRHLPPDERSRRPVVLEDNVWVGAKALVLKGSHIGADTVVGSGAVVRGTVPPRVVVVGNPAQVVRHL
jgi:acetyltransferase-like isoleucine patch superfamily enzyme